MNTEEDEELKRVADQNRRSEESKSSPVNVARKPVPSDVSAIHPLPPLPTEEQAYQPYRPGFTDSAPTPGNSIQQRQSLRLNVDTEHGLHRRPVPRNGLPDFNADFALAPLPSIGQDVQTLRYPQFDNTQSTLHDHARQPLTGFPEGLEREQMQHAQQSGERSNDNKHGASTKFQPVTMIRRDPASCSQWNIGTITLLERSFPGSNVRPVNVELIAPGYGRFAKRAGFETPRPTTAGSDVDSIRRAIHSATISPTTPTTPSTPTAPFGRVVDFRKMALSDLKRTAYQRTNSADSVGRFDPAKSGLEKNVLAFNSPWNGVCTFVNGIDGKTLKIKHTINTNGSSVEGLTANVGELRFNLGWSILSNVKESRSRRKENEPDALPIPKLLESKKANFRRSFQHLKNKSRESFQRSRSSNRDDDVLRDLSSINTPTTNHFEERGEPYSRQSGQAPRPQLSQYAQSYTSTTGSASEEHDHEANRLSLKLGRERAGGGFRGHSAKLGKIIIEDEGLKMCDLVVGAAMGVWWQHYDG